MFCASHHSSESIDNVQWVKFSASTWCRNRIEAHVFVMLAIPNVSPNLVDPAPVPPSVGQRLSSLPIKEEVNGRWFQGRETRSGLGDNYPNFSGLDDTRALLPDRSRPKDWRGFIRTVLTYLSSTLSPQHAECCIDVPISQSNRLLPCHGISTGGRRLLLTVQRDMELLPATDKLKTLSWVEMSSSLARPRPRDAACDD